MMRARWGTLVPLSIAGVTWIVAFLTLHGLVAVVSAKSPPLQFPVDCKPYQQRGMKFLLKNFHKCSRELKANVTSDKEYEERLGCALKCTMRNVGFTENDLVSDETMRRAASAVLPDELIPPVIHLFKRHCDKKLEKLNPGEEFCKTYSDYAFCIQNVIADIVDDEELAMFCIHDNKKKKT